jgi:lipopolysaccharide/colanic/teichoic acid biosynthesis glycosyltransferase
MRPERRVRSEWARDNGDRLTRVGRWLRRFRLDELPQLINILKGDMNLVGPRPHPVSNLPLFVLVMRNAPSCGEPIPYYALRWMVRPGITGWAQVRYQYANDLEEEVEKMRHDLYYIKHMSLCLDLRILFETVKTVLCGRESAAPVAHGPTVAPTREGAPMTLASAARPPAESTGTAAASLPAAPIAARS